jgi:hypothetical protein
MANISALALIHPVAFREEINVQVCGVVFLVCNVCGLNKKGVVLV